MNFCEIRYECHAIRASNFDTSLPLVVRNTNSAATRTCRLEQQSSIRCSTEVHKILARVQCTVQLCELDVSNLHPHHTVAGRSSVSLIQSPFTFPSKCLWGPPITSYLPGRSIPCTRARHGSTHHRTLCTAHGLYTSVIKCCVFRYCSKTWLQLVTNYC
jgi:hypothetical protein